MYLFKKGGASKINVQLMGSGAILRDVIAASDLLEKILISRLMSGVSRVSMNCVAKG